MSDEIRQIAMRLRELREIADVTPEAMAQQLHISAGEYLAYEGGETDIPVSLLYEAAGIFKVDLTELLSGESPRLHVYQLVRAGKGLDVKRREQYKYQSLAYNFNHKKVEPFLVEVPYLGEDAPIHFNAHPGQEFNYCLEGTLNITINGKALVLHEGDSLYFDSNYPHGMRAEGGKKAKFLALIF